MKASQEARKLFPYLLPLLDRVIRGAVGGSAGSPGVGGAPSPHTLSSDHHTGTLANSQAPQFLLSDGSRTLTGNLAVASGKTIDGVDLSAHVLDPDAHHARATAGNTGIQIVSQAVSLVLNSAATSLEINSGLRLASAAAGGGLGIDATTRVLFVNPGDGIDILTDSVNVDVTDIIDTMAGLGEDASNNIQVKRHTDSGLAFGISGGLTLGTPLTIAAGGTNNVTGVGHGHAVTSSSDVGTTAPGVNRLLHATSAGGLILATLTVKGSVDIINGGDLTVGSNVFFVDVSQESVGIMRAPDPQFALDVNGPIRGTELVGKHAIQLEDLALLLHFDGGEPYQTNFTGEVNAVPLGQVPTTNTGPVFFPGKFYKAVALGPTRTNLCTNPSFETNTTGWSVAQDGTDLALARASDDSYFGSWSGKLTFTTSTGGAALFMTPVASSAFGHYYLGAWLRAAVPTTITMVVYRGNSPFTAYATATCNLTEDWQYFSTVPVASPVTGEPVRIGFFMPGVSSSNTIWVDGVSLEQANFPTWYIDGSLGSGYSWSGTAHNSTSTRTNTRLIYGLDGMVNHRWSLMGWFRLPFQVSANTTANYFIGLEFSTSHYVRILFDGVNLSAALNHSSLETATFAAGGVDPDFWHHFAVVYTPGLISLYLDGDLVDTETATYSGVPTELWLGAVETGPTYGTAMLDDICVSRQALSAERVRAIYESDAPVFAESSVFHFRATPKGLVWADEEGLWMRDTAGDTVLGAYGGDAATKSWGGFTLAAGDIAFGRFGASDGGWLLFDRDGVSSKPYLSVGYSDKTIFAFDSGGASLAGVLDIDSAGGIYQGTGTFTTPTTGLKIWNASGIGRIAGYNAGTAQWYANTDGKLYAGGGNVVLDASGIALGLLSYPIRFIDGAGNRMGSIWQRDDLGVPTRYEMELSAGNATRDGAVALKAVNSAGSIIATINVDATETSTGAGITTNAGQHIVFSTNGGGHTEIIPQLQIWQPSTTAAIAALELNQADLSEEFIQFNGSVAASNPISQSALGAYWGKVRVSINGTTFGWLAVYS